MTVILEEISDKILDRVLELAGLRERAADTVERKYVQGRLEEAEGVLRTVRSYIEEPVEELDDITLYWLAGLLEGSGSLTSAPPSAPTQIRIVFKSRNKSSVERAAELMGVKVYEIKDRNSKGSQWRAVKSGGRAAALLERLLPYISETRQEEVRALLKEYHRSLSST